MDRIPIKFLLLRLSKQIVNHMNILVKKIL